MDPGWAILISAGFATAGWLYNGRLQRAASRRQHTYTIILKQQDDEIYDGALMTLRRIVKTNLDEHTFAALMPDDINRLDYILNYYEFLSASIWCGDIDEKLIKMCDESTIRKLDKNLKFYIEKSRSDRKQPTMWEHLVNLVDRWENGTKRSQIVCEFFLQRPCKHCPRWITIID